MKPIDLRSDTVTKPTKEMLHAMMNAQVGDDVFEEDPTVNALEEKTATLFGKEAGLFCPSGTMTNQIAMKMLTQPAEEIICERGSHVYFYEGGGMAFNSGLSVRTVEGNRGRINAQQVLENINAENVHFPTTTLVVLENTCNRGGGSCYEVSEIEKIKKICDENNLKLHLDGARIFNALVAKNNTAKEFGKNFESVSVCLSKGMGSPMGSVLVSTKENIKKAKRLRKVFGGGMRQAGFIAAAGIFALDNNINRLADDHHRAKEIEKTLKALSYIEDVIPVETNIIIFKLNEKLTTDNFLTQLKEKNIKAFSNGKQLIRFVTHLDFDDEMLNEVTSVLKNIQ